MIDEQTRGRISAQVLRNAGTPLPTAEPDLGFLASLGIEESDSVCLFVGRLGQNRLAPLVHAFPRALAQEPSLKLVVAGAGADLDGYLALAGERIVFVGFRSGSELSQLLGRADIALSHCWWDDGFPLKVFQYMGAGTAILVEGRPQMREVLTDGRDAVFFKDEEELADKLVALARDPDLRSRLGDAARRLLIEQHSWDVRSEQLRQIVSSLVEAGAGVQANPEL